MPRVQTDSRCWIPTPEEIVERAAIVREAWTEETFAARARHFAIIPGKNYYVGSTDDDDGWTPPSIDTPLGWWDE